MFFRARTPCFGVDCRGRLDVAVGLRAGVKHRSTGQPDVKWTQDLWGRTASYTNSLGETTTTEYDGFGKVTKTSTPASGSTTTYKYGALSGDGTTEYQGVVTSMTVSNHGAAGATGTYKATYDLDGNILTQENPGGITQVNDYDPGTGKHTGLSYTGPVKDQAGNTTTAPWISWGITRDATGRIVGENTPDGDLFTGTGTTGDRAAAYDKNYTYDHAGRLTEVTDLTAPAGENLNTDPTEGPLTPVTVRKYAFDKNGNRTSLTTTVNGTQTAKKTWAFDAADRPTTGYVHDVLGRQTTVPAADTPRTGTAAAGTNAITIGNWDNDTARTITRGGITTTIGLDAAGRRLTLASTRAPGTETKHYTDDSDNPGWSTRTQGTTTTTTRYESTIGGYLALTITNHQVELAVNTPPRRHRHHHPPHRHRRRGRHQGLGPIRRIRQPAHRHRRHRGHHLRLARRRPARPGRQRPDPHGSTALQQRHRSVHQPRPRRRRQHHHLRLPPRPHRHERHHRTMAMGQKPPAKHQSCLAVRRDCSRCWVCRAWSMRRC